MSHSSGTPIQISASQVERIVRDVLASLAADKPTTGSPSVQPASVLGNVAAPIPAVVAVTAPQPASPLHLTAAVLSLDILRSLPKDTKQLTLPVSTLVTPAAKDYLREKGIVWSRASDSERAGANPVSVSTPIAEKKEEITPAKRMFVTGSVLWLRNLEKQLCPKATYVDQIQMDDASAIRSVAHAIRSGATSAIAIVKAPHATLWQAARDEALRPAIISQWSDLAEVFREVPTNMLIVPATRWNIAGSANIARKFLEHINANR